MKVKKFNNKLNMLLLLTTFLLLINLNVLSASFSVSNYSIEKQYAPNDALRGWINISFNNEPATSLFQIDDRDNISLIKLLELNDEYDYSCVPGDCGTAYAGSNSETTKTFSLLPGQSTVYGLKFTGNDVSAVESFELTIKSDAGESCTNQLKIDIFDDETFEIKNENLSNSLCSSLKRKGCFTSANKEYVLGVNYYCQKINFPEAPGFRIGAWVKKISESSAKLYMEVFDTEGYSLPSTRCELPTQSASPDGTEISCDIKQLFEPGDYYVCIRSSTGAGDYRIQGNDAPATACGFYGLPYSNPTEIAAYNIFMQPKKFQAFGAKTIKNSLSNGINLASEMSNYLTEKYSNYCPAPAGCIIPIKFVSETSQEITLSNLTARVQTSGGLIVDDRIYDLSENAAKISGNHGILKLDEAHLSVPNEYGNTTITLKFKGDEILLKEISIEKIPTIRIVIPQSAAAGNPTEFVAYITKGETNITKYEWEFGDGAQQITSINRATHMYNSTGTYELKLSVTDAELLTSLKTFSILVGSPQEIVNTTLEEKRKALENLKLNITGYSLFVRESLENLFDTAGTEDKIKSLQQAYKNAATEQKYIEIMLELNNLNIPESIQKTKSTGLLPYFPEREIIDLYILEEIGGSEFSGDTDNSIDSVYGWNALNLDTKIKFEEFTAEYDGYSTPALNVFELDMSANEAFDYPVFVIFEGIDNLKFDKYYSEKVKEGYAYIELENPNTKLMFSTTEDFSFVDLPVFISPSLEELPIETEIKPPKPVPFPIALFLIILAIVILIGIVAYIGMQIWYKQRYESHLFKNRNDLFNILAYIHNAKSRGLTDSQIKEKLKSAGWSGEQISYAIKKYSGKKTWMPGPSIPFGIDKKKIMPQSPKGPSVKKPEER